MWGCPSRHVFTFLRAFIQRWWKKDKTSVKEGCSRAYQECKERVKDYCIFNETDETVNLLLTQFKDIIN